MPDDTSAITIRIVDRLDSIDPAQWDACADATDPSGIPFLRHGFLAVLEASGSVGGRSGWQPHHLVAESAEGTLLGAVPLYAKFHSQGEYVFDHGWARAYENAGGSYYPKLQITVPFTPVPGPRLLLRSGAQADAVADGLCEAAIELCRSNRLSSVHVTFCSPSDCRRLEKHGFMLRAGMQYHWNNRGWRSFEEFLGALSSRKRKAIRKERQSVQREGLRLRALTGDDIKPHHWDDFFAFYMDTGSRKWGSPYLTRAFFDLIGASMAERIVLILAEADGRAVGGALNFRSDDALFGRNWGCVESHNFLHFEACYYQAIEYAIDHGLQRVEAGAQGEHKIQRGYLPSVTHSMHWIADRGLRTPVERFLQQEREAVQREAEALLQFSPYRRDEAE